MPLSDLMVRKAAVRGKNYRLGDADGLYVLVVAKSGNKLWRLDYRFEGVRQTMSFGKYPHVTLKMAREQKDHARRLLASGQNPIVERRTRRAEFSMKNRHSFEAIAREWFEARKPQWKENHASRILMRLENDVFPRLGRRPIHEISAVDVLKVLNPVVKRGAVETAHRILSNISQINRYAVTHQLVDQDVTRDLRGALPSPAKQHYPTITDPADVGALLRAIEDFRGYEITRQALRLAPLVFVRPGELRGADWAEFDLEVGEWKIPAERMKGKKAHLVPLAPQALEVLNELKLISGRGRLLFPGARTLDRPISDNTLNAALRRMGYTKDEMVAHGFRAMASTLLNEKGWSPDVIERQLAHVERNGVRAAYNHADYLEKRREMMQWWADYLDGLRGFGLAPTVNVENRLLNGPSAQVAG